MEENTFARLPRMDRLLACPPLGDSPLPYASRKEGARMALEELRDVLRREPGASIPPLEAVARRGLVLAEVLCRPRLGKVVNATGVVLHTNLGRAPLSARAAEAVARVAAGYSNLEYDLDTGRRGSRTAAVEEQLCALTGAEGAYVVNNNAAAVLLMLAALAPGLGVAISRGELVEIGGSFRVPDVMVQSGARLVEVGTTNKTRPEDYAQALAYGRAQALLKVHPSNFRLVGFTQGVEPEELASLATRYSVPLLCDLGSGAPGPGPWPQDYPTIAKWLPHAQILCCSGDKLLGGPQCGILLGKREAVAKLKAHPLARALRLDKLSLAALEATLLDWRDGVLSPVQTMLAATQAELEHKAKALTGVLSPCCPCRPVPCESQAGGGALPGESLPSWAVELDPPGGPEALEAFFRRQRPPVIGRIHGGKLLLDMRTLLPGDEDLIQAALAAWAEGQV